MLYLSISELEFENTIVIFEISTLEFVCWQNFSKKHAEIWDVKCLIWVLLGLNLKKLLIYIVNFGIGFTFFKGPGSNFSEGPGPDPRPLYKVCRKLVKMHRSFID